MQEDLPVSVHHMRKSVVSLAYKLILTLLVTEVAYLVVLLGLLSIFGDGSNTVALYVFLGAVHLVKMAFEGYFLVHIAVKWATTRYYLNRHHLVVCEGVLVIDETVFDLSNIRSVNHSAGWLGRMLNFGDLYISLSASGYHDNIWLYDIADPKTFERMFSHYLKERPIDPHNDDE